MNSVLGIVNFADSHIWVQGMQKHRPIGAFSFLGRYSVIDFPISNMTNSGINQIQVYIKRKPRSLIEHLGTGRHYNINSKRGRLHILFSETGLDTDLYNTDISAFAENLECIEHAHCQYVVIAPSYMIYTQDYDALFKTHIESGADITLLYHSVDNARESFLNCNTLNLNRQKGVLSLERNRGNAKNRHIFMDTYIMKKELFISLIRQAQKVSSMYTLRDIVNAQCGELDVRGVAHRGYFASITDFKSYYNANLELIDFKTGDSLFDPSWPIYTRTNDSCPTQYFEGANVRDSVVSNGCRIEGTIEHSVIGRGCTIEKGAVVKNSVILANTFIGANAHIENQVVDKHTKIVEIKNIVAEPGDPGYIKRGDTL